MKILITGTEENFNECRAVLEDGHRVIFCQTRQRVLGELTGADLVIDFNLEEEVTPLSVFAESAVPLLLNTILTTLKQARSNDALDNRRSVFGFNGLPGFFSGKCLEITTPAIDVDRTEIANLLGELGLEYVIVRDQVGMVAPRIICMIINEAFFTVSDNTAQRNDIDLAMKLGTNYPYGPFEWCQRIGIANVFSVLQAAYVETGDARYRVAPLLKQEYDVLFPAH